MSDGDKEKAKGMEMALDAANEEWKQKFREVALEFASDGRPFTSEDVVAIVGLPRVDPGLHKNNAVGAMMSGLARAGYIVKVGHRNSRRTISHASEIATWVGVKYMRQTPEERIAELQAENVRLRSTLGLVRHEVRKWQTQGQMVPIRKLRAILEP